MRTNSDRSDHMNLNDRSDHPYYYSKNDIINYFQDIKFIFILFKYHNSKNN